MPKMSSFISNYRTESFLKKKMNQRKTSIRVAAITEKKVIIFIM
jgi:hypothetical protein